MITGLRLLTMSSGKTHDKVNLIVMASYLIFGIITKSDPTIITGLGIGIGTIWLSPDLDLRTSNPCNRLGPFKILMGPYRAMCGHHRSWVSHSPIVSSLIRVAYFMSPIVIYCYLNGYSEILAKLTLSAETFWFLVGLELATDLHLFLDWQYSYFKQIKKVTR